MRFLSRKRYRLNGENKGALPLSAGAPFAVLGSGVEMPGSPLLGEMAAFTGNAFVSFPATEQRWIMFLWWEHSASRFWAVTTDCLKIPIGGVTEEGCRAGTAYRDYIPLTTAILGGFLNSLDQISYISSTASWAWDVSSEDLEDGTTRSVYGRFSADGRMGRKTVIWTDVDGVQTSTTVSCELFDDATGTWTECASQEEFEAVFGS